MHVSTMADDYYRFVERAHMLRGENTGKVYRLGDRVTVQVVKVDMERRQVDLGLVEILDAVRAVRGEPRAAPQQGRSRAQERGRKPAAGEARRGQAAAGQEGARRPQAALTIVRSIVIGTAGHIDHGKSALVRALTGTDPDRLKEEQARGITIDLGFAHLRRTAGRALNLAFVDVPGHERFVKNMLAGAGGIDLVMLVVAADESVMPQTREHFHICRLLQVPAGRHRAHQERPRRRRDAGARARSRCASSCAGSFLADAPDRRGVVADRRGLDGSARDAGVGRGGGAGRARPTARCGCRSIASSR